MLSKRRAAAFSPQNEATFGLKQNPPKFGRGSDSDSGNESCGKYSYVDEHYHIVAKSNLAVSEVEEVRLGLFGCRHHQVSNPKLNILIILKFQVKQ